MVNIAALEKVITFIEDHPEKHVQSRWTCETGACMAGWGALLHGYSVLPGFRKIVVPPGKEHDLEAAISVRQAAQEVFDIDYLTAHLLFLGGNSAETLRLMVKDLANGEDIAKNWESHSDVVEVLKNGTVRTSLPYAVKR